MKFSIFGSETPLFILLLWKIVLLDGEQDGLRVGLELLLNRSVDLY